MKVTKMQIAIYLLIAAGFIVSIAFYPKLPDRMASHWNAQGQVDDSMSRPVGAFFAPCIMVFLAASFMLIVKIDPLKANIARFMNYYEGFILFMMAFLLIIHIWMLLWNVGIETSPNLIMPVLMGALFFFIGVISEKVEPNWFIGIRTPWTLSNDLVWKKTHEFSAVLLKIAGIVMLAGILFGQWAILFIIIPVIPAVLIPCVYSYVIYKKVTAEGFDGDAEEMKADRGSGNATWDNLKEGYLYQIEKSLANVKRLRKKEILDDVSGHLDEKFSELNDDDRTWENFQQIITEMGPAGDYAELLSGDREKVKPISICTGKFLAIVIVAGLVIALTFISTSRQIDNIDLPFMDDPEVIGRWETVDFVTSIGVFHPQVKTWQHDLFLSKLQFDADGKLTARNRKVPSGYPLRWTRGVVISAANETASKYHIEDINGAKYMFYEWKSGDYTIRHQKPAYYVLKKEPVQTDIAVTDLKLRPSYNETLRDKGHYDLTAAIHNKGEEQSPQFGVYFYMGDTKSSRPRTHAAGPIKPAGIWNEYTSSIELKEGDNLFSVVVDPHKKIIDPQRNNNTKTLLVTVKDGKIIENSFVNELQP